MLGCLAGHGFLPEAVLLRMGARRISILARLLDRPMTLPRCAGWLNRGAVATELRLLPTLTSTLQLRGAGPRLMPWVRATES